MNADLINKMQELINTNANKESNSAINEKAKNVEIQSLRVFGMLNQLKKDMNK